MSQTIEVGNTVERLAKDYTGGRIGQVIEIKEERARIHWTKAKYGAKMSLHTWVRMTNLKLIATNLNP